MKIDKELFLTWLQSKGLQPRTIEQYERCFNNLVVYDKFNQDNVDRFVAKYRSNISRSFLRTFKAYLLRNPEKFKLTLEKAERVRLIDVPKLRIRKRKAPDYLSPQEVRAIEKNMRSEGTKIMLLLTYYCALRRDELLNIRLKDLNWSQWKKDPEMPGKLKITRKGGKQGIVPVKPEVMRRFKKWINESFTREYDFKLPLFDIPVKRWARILHRASMKALDTHVNPHLLRHSMAMHLRKNDWSLDEVKEFLGHESIATTQIYARVSPEIIYEKYSAL